MTARDPVARGSAPPAGRLLLLLAGMRCLAALEIGDETRDLPCSCLGSLDRADSVEDGVSVDAVELCEARGSAGRRIERGLEILGHAGRGLTGVCGVPSSVRLGGVDLADTGGMH